MTSISLIALGRVLKQLRDGNIIHSQTSVERLLHLSEEFQKAEVLNYEVNIGKTVNEVLG